jgi:glutamyl-tRNA synthetase
MSLPAPKESYFFALNSVALIRAAAQEPGLKARQMLQPIRVAVCGRKNAPPLFETLQVLGRETALARIDQAVENLAGAK